MLVSSCGNWLRISALHFCSVLTLLLIPTFSFSAEPAELEKGISAYRSGEHSAALRYLETAIDKYPASAAAYYYLGLTTFALEDYEKSVAALKTSLKLDKGRTDAHLYLGMAYYHIELYEFSVQALDQAIKDDTGGATAWFFRGLCHWRMGEFQQARSDLKRAGELDAAIRMRPEYQQVMRDIEEGHSQTSSAPKPARTASGSRTDPVRNRESLPRVFRPAPYQAKERPWSLELAAGLLFDDNVTSAEQDVTSDQSDMAVVLELSSRYTFLQWEDVEFTAGYDFYQSLYTDLDDFNLQSHVLSIDAFRAAGLLDAGLGYSFLASRIGGDSLLNAHTLTGSLGQALTGLWYPNVLFKLQAREFPDDSRRDGSQVTIGVDNFFFPEGLDGHLLLGIRHISEDTDEDYLDYRGNQLRFAVKHDLVFRSYEMRARGQYEYMSRDYQDYDPSIGRKRKDHLNDFRLNLETFMNKKLSTLLEYEHIDSDSNLPSADYTENLFTMLIRYSF